MYTRLTRSGGRSYLQIVEGFRTEAGVRQRVVANLGRLDQLEGKKLEQRLTGLGKTSPQQLELFAALEIKQPA